MRVWRDSHLFIDVGMTFKVLLGQGYRPCKDFHYYVAKVCALTPTLLSTPPIHHTTTTGKQREMISLLAESHADMTEWINILTAVAGTDATPLRYTFVRTISPILSENMYTMRNVMYESPLHALCGSAEGPSKTESEKTLPATAAWLIHRGCPVNPSNLKGEWCMCLWLLFCWLYMRLIM